MMRLVLAASLFLLAAPVMAQEAATSAVEDFIRPGFHQLAAQSASLGTKVAAMCASPSEAALQTSRNQFKSVVTAYSRVEFVQIGPLGQADRLQRLLFWPDRRGIALKQVQQALAAEDETAANARTLKEKSVAMQGLVALEYVLFGSGAEGLATADGAYRCRYASAIATLVADLAATIDGEWADPAGFAAALENPKPDAADFRTRTEVLEKLAATLVNGAEAIRDQRLTPILGASGDAPKPKSALFWRSGMTAPALTANFAGLAEFFNKAKFPEAMGAENAWIANGANFEFANAARAAGLITSPMEQAVADSRQIKALQYMVIVTKSLDTLLGQNMSAALGLSVGFSSLDGD